MSAAAGFHGQKCGRYLSLLGWGSKLRPLPEAMCGAVPGAKVYIFGDALGRDLAANSEPNVLVAVDSLLMSNTERAKVALGNADGLLLSSAFELLITDGAGLGRYLRHANESNLPRRDCGATAGPCVVGPVSDDPDVAFRMKTGIHFSSSGPTPAQCKRGQEDTSSRQAQGTAALMSSVQRVGPVSLFTKGGAA